MAPSAAARPPIRYNWYQSGPEEAAFTTSSVWPEMVGDRSWCCLPGGAGHA